MYAVAYILGPFSSLHDSSLTVNCRVPVQLDMNILYIMRSLSDGVGDGDGVGDDDGVGEGDGVGDGVGDGDGHGDGATDGDNI